MNTPPPRRLGLALLGIALFAVLLWLNPSLPDAAAFALVSVPLALCWYGLTSRSALSVALQAGAIAAGLTLASWARGLP
ncbi:hypothetical protein [Halolamina salina]|uniref:Uncharacterized protein n=1 Tax=Halolamina salina TaxID=1220023 RepID=A0ABD6BB07_9EURY